MAQLAVPATTQSTAQQASSIAASAQSSPDNPPPGALLATVSSHSAAVNCVRWAPTGNLLASGGDDAVVLIYEQLPGEGQSAAFAASSSASTENWRVRRPLRAHSGDVTDVCWSPDGEKLASASVDNAIYIWNVRSERMLVRLDGHKGLVKGVAWDPVGRYLASQSDDRTLRIWRTSDWKTEKVISKPFDSAVYKENSMAFFLRISWSPCGTQLLATNAFKKPGAHVAPMFSRESAFEDQIEFIGHREPVVSTRFSPRLYRAHPKKIAALRDSIEAENKRNENTPGYVKQIPPTDQPTYTCLALGSKDCGATIWQAAGVRPFFDMAQMFDMDVLDLAWGTDGYTFVSCSTDGKVMYVRFEPEELGIVVSQEETRTILTKVWREFGGGGNNGVPIPESATQLRMERDIAERIPIERGDTLDVVEDTKDVEAMRKAVASAPTAPVNTSNAIADRNSLPAPIVVAAAVARENGPTPPADPKLMAAQAEVRVRGGKRRITPMTVTAAAALKQSTPSIQQQEAPAAAFMVGPPAPGDGSPWKRPRVETPTNIPERVAAENTAAQGSVSIRMNGNHQIVSGGNSRTAHDENGIPRGGRAVTHAAPIFAPSIIGLSMMLLPDRGEGSARCRVISTDVPPTVLESREYHGNGGGYVVMCSVGGKVQWRDFHAKSSAVSALAGIGGKYAAVGTADGMLFLYSASSGRRLAPPIAIDSAPHMLEALCVGRESAAKSEQGEVVENWFVILVSRSALCSVFDVRAKRLVCARSAASLLARPQDPQAAAKQNESGVKPNIIREIACCKVTELGEPILVLSDGHAFVYSRDFCSWLRVADDSSPNSDFVRTIPSSKNVGILRSLQSGSGIPSKSLTTLSGMGDLQRSAVESLAHLESLMESAIVLGTARDYRYYLTSYATRIAGAVSDDVENCENRLRELCDSLLNPGNPSEEKTVLGMNCRELLSGTVLPVVSANRQMQRFVAEYSESLEEIKKISKTKQC